MTATDSRPATAQSLPIAAAPAGASTLSSHLCPDTQNGRAAEGQDSPPVKPRPMPTRRAPAGSKTSHGHSQNENQGRLAVAVYAGQPVAADHPTSSRPALLADPSLALAADVLDDLERIRIANRNRLQSLTDPELFGLDVRHPDIAQLAALVEMVSEAEHQAELNLARTLRRHPLWPWISAQRGIGAKQGARLLAAIGDPYWNDLHDRPRKVSELWSYAGYGNAADQRRRAGTKSNWSATARMRAYLVAVSCMKQPSGTRYRDVYEATRQRYAAAEITDGHKHNRALRAVSKEILRDLWREARRIHLNAAAAAASAAAQPLPAATEQAAAGMPPRPAP